MRDRIGGDSCRLTVIHDELREGVNDELYGGWMMILSGLKTLLETGESLTTPSSLRYSQGSSLARRPATPHAPLLRRGRGVSTRYEGEPTEHGSE